MKVARFAAAPLAVALFLSSACSDPPSPPPQAAVSVRVGVTPGKICSHTNNNVSLPLNTAGVISALSCDLRTGCKPDEFIVVDRDRATTVSCSVAPNGSSYTVAARVAVDGTATGDPSLTFGLSGTLGPTGGTAKVNQQNTVSKGGGIDNMCTVEISSATGTGLIKTGGIWGSVKCTDFRDPSDISETGCALDALFLFENCDG